MNKMFAWHSILAACLLASAGNSIAADESDERGAERGRRIFRCESDGKITISDTACSTDPNRQEFRPGHLNSFSSELLPRPKGDTSKKKTTSERRENSAANDQLRSKQRCQRLTDRLAAIAEKLHAGYTAEQGRRLDRQRRELEDQQRAAKCQIAR